MNLPSKIQLKMCFWMNFGWFWCENVKQSSHTSDLTCRLAKKNNHFAGRSNTTSYKWALRSSHNNPQLTTNIGNVNDSTWCCQWVDDTADDINNVNDNVNFNQFVDINIDKKNLRMIGTTGDISLIPGNAFIPSTPDELYEADMNGMVKRPSENNNGTRVGPMKSMSEISGSINTQRGLAQSRQLSPKPSRLLAK